MLASILNSRKQLQCVVSEVIEDWDAEAEAMMSMPS